jgi:hypothetical protein
MRHFHKDFLQHAIKNLSPMQTNRVQVALDCAIIFGALEALGDNKSLQDVKVLEKVYAEQCERLKRM